MKVLTKNNYFKPTEDEVEDNAMPIMVKAALGQKSAQQHGYSVSQDQTRGD